MWIMSDCCEPDARLLKGHGTYSFFLTALRIIIANTGKTAEHRRELCLLNIEQKNENIKKEIRYIEVLIQVFVDRITYIW